MSDSTSTLTGAGYQPDGSGAQQENTLPKEGEAKEGQNPAGAGDSKEGGENGAVKPNGEQGGNPLTALVQNRQQHRDTADQYQAQIAVMQQEIANLKAQQTVASPAAPAEWKNPFDETEQPVDFFRAELERTKAEVRELKEEGGQAIADSRSVQALADFEADVSQQIARAAQKTPELLQAYGFINDRVTSMLEGQGLTGRRLSQAVRNHVLQAYVNGQTSGMSHVQTTAQMALNMGFQETAPAKQDPVKRGQKAADQSLGHVAAKGGDTTPPSAQQLAAYSKEQLKADGGAGLNRIKEILKGNIPIE